MKSTANPGDKVEIHLTKTIYEGVLLESPETGIILLKLSTGYNIGFNKKDVLEIKVLKKFKKDAKETAENPPRDDSSKDTQGGHENLQAGDTAVPSGEPKKSSEKPNIALVITGGTIASKYDSRTGGVHPLTNSEELFKYYPELFEKVNVARVEVPFMKASESMNFSDWKKIAKIVLELVNDQNIRGVIVTHGTDTLHYTSSALSFFLRNLNKPIVLTYSQRSIDRASSDANLNLKCSALAAISDIAEVMLVGHGSTNDNFCYAMPGTKVRKLHSSRRDAFKAVNAKPFAKIYSAPPGAPQNLESGGNRIEILSDYNKRNNKKVELDLKFEEKVALVKFYPGQDPDILNYYLKNKYKGIIIEATGLGHVAVNFESEFGWNMKLKELVEKGVAVCITSQCIFGRVDGLVYSTGRKLIDAGAIFLEDMLSETAFVKLGWVLGHPEWNVKEKMLENISGEFNKRLEE